MRNQCVQFGVLRPALLALAVLLGGCGGGDAGAPASGGAPDPGSTAVTVDTKTVGTLGATLSIDGASLALADGALTTDTAITLESRPVDAQAAESLRLRLSPAGRRLESPSTLTIDLPGAPAGTQAFWLVDGDAVLAPSTRVGDRFQLSLSSLGFGTEGRRVPLAVGRPRALADGDGVGGELSLRIQACQDKVATLRKRLARLNTADAIAELELLSDALLETIANCSALEAQQLRQAACTERQTAVNKAAPARTLSELRDLMRSLLGTQAAVERAGADCVPDTDVQALIAVRAEGYLSLLAEQVRRGDFGTEPGVRALSSLFDISGACGFLDLGTACDQLRTSIFPDMLDTMRRAAFDDCRDRGAALSVAQFLDLGAATGRDGPFLDLARFRMAEVEADLMQCTAPTLSVRVFETVDGSPEALPDRDMQLQPLQGFADYRLAGTVRPPRQGQIVLEGPVRVARCPDGSAPAVDLVVRTANNLREVARRPHDGQRFTLDRRPIDLAVPDLLRAAALDPEAASGVSLLIRQEGAACASITIEGQSVLDQPVLLFQLDLALASATLSSRWSGSISASTELTATLRGTRVNQPSTFQLNSVLDSTTELVDVAMTYSQTVPLLDATELLPGVPVSLNPVAPAVLTSSGAASVASTLILTNGGCQINRFDRSGTTIAIDNMRAGGILELIPGGQLRITAGGLRGAYVVTGQGDQSGDNDGCFDPRNFSSRFGPVIVGGDDFVELRSASTTTTVPEGSSSVAGSAVVGGSAFTSTEACQLFLRKHLGRLQTRLLASEHVVSCQQRVVLTWQLQRLP